MKEYIAAAFIGGVAMYMATGDDEAMIWGTIPGIIALFLFRSATEFFFSARERMKEQDHKHNNRRM